MNKSQLIADVARQAEITKAQAERAINAALGAIQSAVAGGEEVTLVGFGSFKRAARAAREGRNPRTGETVTIPARAVPRFTPGKEFKAACV